MARLNIEAIWNQCFSFFMNQLIYRVINDSCHERQVFPCHLRNFIQKFTLQKIFQKNFFLYQKMENAFDCISCE